jgi:hypothetical protein
MMAAFPTEWETLDYAESDSDRPPTPCQWEGYCTAKEDHGYDNDGYWQHIIAGGLLKASDPILS